MKIMLYTRPNCSLCEKTKQFLESKGLHYFNMNIDLEGRRQYIKENFPSLKELPVVLINDKVIGGHQHLVDYLENERIEK